ncbi:MAG TPA: leucyl aminopeptidase [Phycisphaerae bacterium]|nr:leucyl aminopeptidase [Phycisphaerae bacterium]
MKQPRLAVRVAKVDRRLRADVLLVPVLVRAGKPKVPKIRGLAAPVVARLDELARRYHGSQQAGAIDDVIMPPQSPIGRIALMSLGETKPVKPTDVRDAAGLAMDWCNKHRAGRVAIAVDALKAVAGEEAVGTWVEGAILGGFRFVELRTKPPENGEPRLSVLCLATSAASTGRIAREAGRARRVGEAVNLIRNIAHEPPNMINPVTLARRAQGLARQHRLRCRVIDDRQLRAMKMGAMLAVGGGSATKPRMIVLEHSGSRSRSKPIVLVGKAVTLDSGGYSLKPAANIPEMKYDKCGGLAVLGVLIAAAALKVRRRIVGIIGAVENMISGEAYRPGDIVRAANGKTIEILSTDAEGRLVLADCLHYAEKTFDPAVLIDIATLTGACKIALGESCAAVLSNNDELAAALIESGERTNERLWRMPLWSEYREPMVGTDADLKNSAGPNGGTMTAAMFLKEFVNDRTAWAHLDIAGVAFIGKQTPICPIGATGFGLRLLIDYILRMK